MAIKETIDESIKWAEINADVLRSLETPRKAYWVTLAICVIMLFCGIAAETYQYNVGMGTAHLSNPHYWDMYLSSFVFWIGMSHSGTLLSAILLITQSNWRKPIYRFAEAMTTFSLLTAAIFPLVHLGRVWNVYWALPYVSDRGLWPSFTSALLWDTFAIITYLCASVLFLFVGMIPDMAICRDSATGWRKKLYRILSAGWTGTDKQWRNFRQAYLLMACFLIPLAVSVHSIVSTDFAASLNPGMHITSFPPYFVAGALFSGCAGIMTLFIMLRYLLNFEQYMTLEIFEKVCKLTFVIAMVWSYLNLIEFASVWYGHDLPNKEVLIFKATGPYSPIFWTMIFCGSVLPFTLAFKKLRRNLKLMMAVSLLINLGMFAERWMIIAPSLSLAFEPHQWAVLWPSIVQWGIVFGSFGWFGFLILIFVKIVPSVSMYEVKELVYHHRRELFHWDDKFILGIHSIDLQHKKLVRLVNELHFAVSYKRGRELLEKTLHDLSSYIDLHLDYEEKLLINSDYPDFDKHKKGHDLFREKISSFVDRHDIGDETVQHELLEFLKGWLTHHIQGEDAHYVAHIDESEHKDEN